jgi:hypothetical protein
LAPGGELECLGFSNLHVGLASEEKRIKKPFSWIRDKVSN